ncbi:hypothetical protein COEREDRAFT_99132 [Coemansia reversa NRRL 1564]|uniref:Protein kinase domain-containing protein n=1 Tax=Coemansia reversa (strain ATCC 12441 / NRRL 1564) TaxID=763665 RepID=A0A2G5B5A4_COERN|nr:hypothetical protein COEREDRAFT_99132 [Coemansia reversa NRRL 1564]|eukprot:PIA14181.1 hypothetical protein COEREDRAFT_99132 [Coemansia reversa NRRL 1564]
MPFSKPHDTPTKRTQHTTTVRALFVEQQEKGVANAEQDTRLGDIASALNNEQYEHLLTYAGSIIAGPQDVSLAPNVIPDTRKESSLSLHDSTPAHCRRIVNVAERAAFVDDPDRGQRRNRIAGDLAERVEYVSIETLNHYLGLVKRYNAYVSNSETLFDDVSGLAPQMTATGLKYPAAAADEPDFAGLYSQDGTSRLSGESALTDYFQCLWEHLQNKRKDGWLNDMQTSALKLIDFQKTRVPGTSHQPDGLFSRSSEAKFSTAEIIFEAKWANYNLENIPDIILGQFTAGSAADHGRIEEAFGNENGMTELGKRIERPVRIVRRATYMYNCVYYDAGVKRNAILKLTWAPNYRLPEGAAYQIIGSACGDLIPKIYSSGILISDSFGYRLEYAIMEDCGETLEQYASRCCKSFGFECTSFYAKMVEVIGSISNCLAIAYSEGVLHRDISPGNIAINRAGAVKLIDWGCARLRINKVIPDLNAIAHKWSFSADQDPYMETRHDSLTGTHPSMSIQVLGNCTKRSLLHDLESVFFTAMYAMAVANGQGSDTWDMRRRLLFALAALCQRKTTASALESLIVWTMSSMLLMQCTMHYFGKTISSLAMI